LSVDKVTIPATVTAATYAVAVTSNGTWTAAVNSAATAWCTASPAAGTGNGTVTVSVTANSATVTRAATVTVTAGTLTKQVVVTQAAAAPALSIDKATIAATVAAATYTLTVTSNLAWTVAVNSGATAWCSVSPAAGNGNGAVTISVIDNNKHAATRVATLFVTAGTLTRQMTVAQAALASPTYAATDEFWPIDNVSKSIHQLWSDVITVPECNKSDFVGSAADCRKNSGYVGYFYSWHYVNEKPTTLCPSPWRVPTNADFVALNNALNSVAADFVTVWHGAFGGLALGTDTYSRDEYGYYWSSTEQSGTGGYSLSFNATTATPSGSLNKISGVQVRCVKQP
jgi:uncharacterized protein (TIGR02145 family)